MSRFLKAIGKFLTWGGVVFGGASWALSGGNGFISDFFTGAAVFFGLIATAGASMWIWNSFRISEKENLELEQRVFRTIQLYHGRITEIELATGSGLPLARCKRFLKKMKKEGDIETHISPEGKPVYVFSGFAHPGDKARARDPLEIMDEIEARLAGTESPPVESHSATTTGPPPVPE